MSPVGCKVLVVAQEAQDYQRIKDLFASSGGQYVQTEWVPAAQWLNGTRANQNANGVDAVVLDGKGDLSELLAQGVFKIEDIPAPVVYIHHTGGESDAVFPTPDNTFDILPIEDLSPALLKHSIRYAIERRELKQALETYQRQELLNRKTGPTEQDSQLRAELDTALQLTERAALESRKAAREARMTATRLEAILNSLTDAVMVYDREGFIVLANSFAIALLGFDPIRMHRASLLRRIRLMHRNGTPVDAEQTHFRRAEEREAVFHEPVRLRNARGRTYEILASALPFYIGREYNGVVVVWNDVTLLERLQEEIRVQNLEMQAEQIAHQAHVEVQRQLIQQREKERVQIARDLHETLLQDLIAYHYGLVEAMDMKAKEDRLAKLRWLQESLTKAIRELRAYCNDLRPPVLSPFGLEKAVRSYLETLKERYPELTIQASLMNDGKRLPEDIRMALYRAFQELTKNVIKHSRASEMRVDLRIEERELILIIVDNGIGFEIPKDWVENARHGHLGLISARERIESIGGILTIDSQPGAGAQFVVRLPLDAPQG